MIFLECGSDFVEMMFKLMKLPISDLVGLCTEKDSGVVSPLVAVRKSLSRLDGQCFIKGELPAGALPAPIKISEIIRGDQAETDAFGRQKRKREKSFEGETSEVTSEEEKMNKRPEKCRERSRSRWAKKKDKEKEA